MQEFKGTKGEWVILEQFEDPILIKGEKGTTDWYSLDCWIMTDDERIIGEVEYRSDIPNSGGFKVVNNLDEMKANAKLIAASKDLLEACQSFIELWKASDMRPEDECHEVAHKTIEAINKALN